MPSQHLKTRDSQDNICVMVSEEGSIMSYVTQTTPTNQQPDRKAPSESAIAGFIISSGKGASSALLDLARLKTARLS